MKQKFKNHSRKQDKKRTHGFVVSFAFAEVILAKFQFDPKLMNTGIVWRLMALGLMKAENIPTTENFLAEKKVEQPQTY